MSLSALASFAAGYLVGARRRRRRAQESPTTTLIGFPDRRRRPSDGIVAEAAIVGHVLGLRLLTLDATVVLSPAVVTAPSSTRPAVPALQGPLRPVDAPASAPLGRRLAEAARSIDEGAAALAQARGG